MHEISKADAILIATLLMAFGCQDSKPEESRIIERMASEQPTLTSTTAPPSSSRLEALRTEPTIDEGSTRAPQPGLPSMPAVESHDGLRIERLVMASEVEDLEPIMASSVFATADDKIYAFIEASNASEKERSLMIHFIGPGGQVTGGIELRIPASAPRWRTWAYTRHAKSPGIWRVEIRDADGALLGVAPFEVEPDC
jgi:hypothetical protein